VLEEEAEIREHGAEERQDDADLKGHEDGVNAPVGSELRRRPDPRHRHRRASS
jgi:hypothetical protein